MVAPRRSRGWLWFFLVLALLGATALAIEMWYNLSQQLTPAQLEQARKRWEEKGSGDYDFEYIFNRQSRDGEHYHASVRDGEVVAVTLNGQPLEPILYPLYDTPGLFAEVEQSLASNPDGRDREVDYTSPLSSKATCHVRARQARVVSVVWNGQRVSPRLDHFFDQPNLNAAIQRRLELDAESGSRVFHVALFNQQDGHLVRYVRSILSTRERLQIELKPPAAEEKS
jgi:hypothetical protein